MFIGIRSKASLILTAVGTAGVVLAGLVFYLIVHAELQDITRKQLNSISVDKSKELLELFRHRLDVLRAISDQKILQEYLLSFPEQQKQLSDPLIDTGLTELIGFWTNNREVPFETIKLIDGENGRVLFSSELAEIGTYRDHERYFQAVETMIPMISRPKHAIYGGKIELFAAAPLVLEATGHRYLVVGGISKEILDEMLSPNDVLYETLDIYLVNSSRLIVTKPRFASQSDVLTKVIGTDAIDKCLNSKTGFSIEGVDYRNEQVFGSYQPFPLLDACLVVEVDEKEAEKALGFLIDAAIGAALVGGIFAALLGGFLGRRIVAPLLKLKKASESFAAGNKSARASLQRNDEIGALAASFDNFSDEIAKKELVLKKRAAELAVTNLRLENSVDELEAFAYAVSHDLRAPLRSIDGFSQALAEDYGDKLDGEAKQFLTFIRESSEEMSQLIDDILLLSRVSRHQVIVDAVDLSQLSTQILDRLNKRSEDRDVILKIQPDLKCNGDEKLIGIAMTNLLSNAWKFSAGKDRIFIEVGQYEIENETAFYIRDKGAGFDMSFVDKLFKPFHRLHSSREFEGTGIGLSTVRRIIEKHGGRIWAEGEVGAGAKFSFTIDPEGASL